MVLRSLALGPAAGLADVASALELEFGTAFGTGVDDLPLGLLRLLCLDTLDLGLHLLVHVGQCPTDGHRTA